MVSKMYTSVSVDVTGMDERLKELSNAIAAANDAVCKMNNLARYMNPFSKPLTNVCVKVGSSDQRFPLTISFNTALLAEKNKELDAINDLLYQATLKLDEFRQNFPTISIQAKI